MIINQFSKKIYLDKWKVNGKKLQKPTMAQGSIPGWDSVKTEIHVLRKGQ